MSETKCEACEKGDTSWVTECACAYGCCGEAHHALLAERERELAEANEEVRAQTVETLRHIANEVDLCRKAEERDARIRELEGALREIEPHLTELENPPCRIALMKTARRALEGSKSSEANHEA